jgi:hypothetical protein
MNEQYKNKIPAIEQDYVPDKAYHFAVENLERFAGLTELELTNIQMLEELAFEARFIVSGVDTIFRRHGIESKNVPRISLDGTHISSQFSLHKPLGKGEFLFADSHARGISFTQEKIVFERGHGKERVPRYHISLPTRDLRECEEMIGSENPSAFDIRHREIDIPKPRFTKGLELHEEFPLGDNSSDPEIRQGYTRVLQAAVRDFLKPPFKHYSVAHILAGRHPELFT